MRASVVALAAVATVVTAGCTAAPFDTAVLVSVAGDGNAQAGGAVTAIADTPYEFPMRNVCISIGKSVQITKVTPWRPTGSIKIVDWGVRPSQGLVSGGLAIGAAPITVKAVGGFTTGPVTVDCSDKTRYDEFYISVSTRTVRSTMYGADLHYGHGKIVHDQFAIALCLTKKCAGVPLDGG